MSQSINSREVQSNLAFLKSKISEKNRQKHVYTAAGTNRLPRKRVNDIDFSSDNNFSVKRTLDYEQIDAFGKTATQGLSIGLGPLEN
jgi:hypothetical protein